ncbi:MAG: hypothetical protein AB7J13_16210 [Pyrinomonadaceae bacterium]
MFPTKMTGFCKNENCPTSHELLAFENGEVTSDAGAEIRRHLTSCEFCSAEVDFYSHYPQDDSTGVACEIPAPLYELAEALLKQRNGDLRSLNDLFRESDPVSTRTVAEIAE